MIDSPMRSLVIFIFIFILEMDCMKNKDPITFDELIEGLKQLFKVSIFVTKCFIVF